MKTPPVRLDHLHVFGLELGSTQSEKRGGFPLPPSRFPDNNGSRPNGKDSSRYFREKNNCTRGVKMTLTSLRDQCVCVGGGGGICKLVIRLVLNLYVVWCLLALVEQVCLRSRTLGGRPDVSWLNGKERNPFFGEKKQVETGQR